MDSARKSGIIVLVVAMVVGSATVAAGSAPVAALEPRVITVPPSAPVPIHALGEPTRIFDSRPGEKTDDGRYAGVGRRGAGSVTEIPVAGRVGVPENATAVMLNLTSVDPADTNYLTVFPCAPGVPKASTLNSPPGDIRANNAFVSLSDTGSVCVFTVKATDFIVDVTGFVPIGAYGVGSFARTDLDNPPPPVRLFDSRPGESTVDGLSAGQGRLAAGSVTEIKVAGRADVPADVTSVFLNVTSVLPDTTNLLTVFPCDASVPKSSSLNSPPNDIRANGVFVEVSPSGTVCVYTVVATDLIVDVSGSVVAAQSAVGFDPARIFESRPGESTVDGEYLGGGRRAGGSMTEIKVAGRGGVPEDASAVFVNLTSVDPSASNYVTVFECGPGVPAVFDVPKWSTLNSPPNDIRANGALVSLSTFGAICVYTVANTDFVVDVTGYVPGAVCDDGGLFSIMPFRPTECEALVALYNSTNGDQWNDNTGWFTNPDPCAWYGVSCVLGSVIALDLENNNLNGPVPAAIGDLKELTRLDLSGNNVTSLPAEIGQLTKLVVLDVSSSASRVRLPREIGILTDLTTLNLEDAQAGDALFGVNAKVTLPFGVGNLTKLTYLNLDNNFINVLPVGIERLTNLTTLSAEGNRLESLSGIGNLTNLTSLNLGYNQLTSLPPEIASLTNLEQLSLEYNWFTAIPPEIAQFTNLRDLNLQYNVIAGDIGPVFAPLLPANNLTSVNLQHNLCMTLTDPALLAWAPLQSSGWADGC